jgi:WXG100 family type VII secretion target
MPSIKVETESLVQQSNSFMRAEQEFVAQLGQMSAQVNSLVGAQWTSQGASQFQELYAGWHATSMQLQDNLSKIATLVQQAANAYATNEAQITASMR